MDFKRAQKIFCYNFLQFVPAGTPEAPGFSRVFDHLVNKGQRC